MTQPEPGADRSISIHHDAIGSAIVSGDGNKVFIYHYHLSKEELVQVEPDLSSPQPSPQFGANPYRGLNAFQVEDAAVYFGREAQVDRLWTRLRDLYEKRYQDPPSIRLLPILGASGSGKSSLARAGLLPELARRPLPGLQQTRVVVMTPGANPLQSLAVVLARIVTQDVSPVEKAAEFERVLKTKTEQGKQDGLQRIANALPAIDVSPLVVLVDQFEEIYSLCKDADERATFIGNLIDAAGTAEGRVSVVLTLRSDFLGEVQQHPQLDQIVGSDQSVIVPAMTVDELRRAIAEPAKQAGHPLDEATLDLLIEQTKGREGALPLLQFALTRIWEGMVAGVAPAETLTQIGGVGGALAGEAQRIYDRLSASEQVIARRIFLGVVQLGEGTRDTRRRVAVDSLLSYKDDPEQVKRVLAQMAAPGVRLLTLAASSTGEDSAEVAHEALFDHWQLLNQWLDESRDDLRFQRRLEEAAQYWQHNNRPDGSLWRPPNLDLLRTYHQRCGDDMTPLQVAFWQASQRAERRRKQFQKLGIGGLAAGFLVTTGLTIFSLFQLQRAERSRLEQYNATGEALAPNDVLASMVNHIAAMGLAQSQFVQFPNWDAESRISYSVVSKSLEQIPEQQVWRHEDGVSSVAITPDGQTIVSGGYDGTVRLWNRDGTPLNQSLTGHEDIVGSVAIAADGQTIVSGGYDGTVRLWNRDGTPLNQPLTGHEGGVRSVAITPDGQTIVSGGEDGTVRLWNRDGTPLNQPLSGHEGPVNSVAIAADGQTIVSAGSEGTVRLWNHEGTPLHQPLTGHQGQVDSVAIAADGQTIVSGGYDGTVRLWNRDGTLLNQPLIGHELAVLAVAITPDGQTIVSGGEDGTVRLWNRDGIPLNQPLTGHEGTVSSVAITPDGQTIVSGGFDNTVRLWNRDGTPIAQPFTGHESWVSSAAIAADGLTIVSGGGDGTVRLWSRDGTPIAQPFTGHESWVSSVAIAPDGQTIVSGGEDGTVRLWRRDGTPRNQSFTGHEGWVNSVAIAPDGQTIVSGGEDGTVRLWRRDGTSIGQPIRGHEDGVSSVAITPDGQTILSGGRDGVVRLWRRDGTLIGQPIRGHQGWVSSVAIAADGQTIVSGGRDGTVRLWQRDWPGWLHIACQRLRNFPVITEPRTEVAREAQNACQRYVWR